MDQQMRGRLQCCLIDKHTFTSNGVQEIDTTKGAGDNRVNLAASTLNLNLGVLSNMGKDVSLSHLDQSEFSVVAVREVVCTRLLIERLIHGGLG